MILSLIKSYQHIKPTKNLILVSLGLPPASCRHSPSCSQYFVNQIKTKGTFKGTFFGLKRLLSCHNWF